MQKKTKKFKKLNPIFHPNNVLISHPNRKIMEDSKLENKLFDYLKHVGLRLSKKSCGISVS